MKEYSYKEDIIQVMKMESIEYFIVCQKYEGKIEIMEKNKCDELKFYKLNELPNNS